VLIIALHIKPLITIITVHIRIVKSYKNLLNNLKGILLWLKEYQVIRKRIELLFTEFINL